MFKHFGDYLTHKKLINECHTSLLMLLNTFIKFRIITLVSKNDSLSVEDYENREVHQIKRKMVGGGGGL